MAVTKLENLINPQVMGDMIDAKIEAQLKLTPYAKVDTTLQGVPGDTKTVPSWNYIGDAEDFDVEAGSEMPSVNLTASSRTFTVKCAGKSVGIYQTAINSGLGNPVGQAETQLAKSIAGKVENDVLEAALSATNVVNRVEEEGAICYKGIVAAVAQFEDEEDGIEKVMFINPKQEAQLLLDEMFLSADKFTSGVAVNGAIGKIAGCWIKKSNRVKLVNDGDNGMVWANPIIKLEPDSAETEYTEDELPAITIFLKKDTQVDHEWLPKFQRHDITASRYYGVALTNEAKVVVAKFADEII